MPGSLVQRSFPINFLFNLLFCQNTVFCGQTWSCKNSQQGNDCSTPLLKLKDELNKVVLKKLSIPSPTQSLAPSFNPHCYLNVGGGGGQGNERCSARGVQGVRSSLMQAHTGAESCHGHQGRERNTAREKVLLLPVMFLSCHRKLRAVHSTATGADERKQSSQ